MKHFEIIKQFINSLLFVHITNSARIYSKFIFKNRNTMKHSLILLTFAINLLISVIGTIPGYIHICKRNDPKLGECIKNSVKHLKPRLGEGIPELKVDPIDPLRLKNLTLNLGPGFKAYIEDIILQGGQNFEILDVEVDFEKKNILSFLILLPEIKINGTYTIDAALGSLPIKGKGPFYLLAKSVYARGILHSKRIIRNKKTFNWFQSMNLNINVTDYNINLFNLYNGNTALGDATNEILNEHKDEVLTNLIPSIEESLTKHLLTTSNNIAAIIPYDEFLPES